SLPCRHPGAACSGALLGDDAQHIVAVAGQLRLADAADRAQSVAGRRPAPGDGSERRVVEDDVGRQVLLGGTFAAPGAQHLEQRLVGHFQLQRPSLPALGPRPPAGTGRPGGGEPAHRYAALAAIARPPSPSPRAISGRPSSVTSRSSPSNTSWSIRSRQPVAASSVPMP